MFDANDRDSWYFGPLGREETNEIFNKEKEHGVFLVRDSGTIRGDFVLCVKEANRNSHYIINKVVENASPRFRIGDQEFSDLPSLLTFYKTHYLDSTPLIRPVGMEHRERYQAKFDFPGRDPEDLPFHKNEILTILHKDEEQWWTARNADGRTGSIPALYLYPEPWTDHNGSDQGQSSHHRPPTIPGGGIVNPMKLPARARVIKTRIPNAYDKESLKLVVGDEVIVTKVNINGNWEGEITKDGQVKKGSFPFTYVQLVDNENADNQNS